MSVYFVLKLIIFVIDGAFSIDTGLEPIGVARSICWAGSLNNLQPAMNGRSDEGAPAGSPMPKSVSF